MRRVALAWLVVVLGAGVARANPPDDEGDDLVDTGNCYPFARSWAYEATTAVGDDRAEATRLAGQLDVLYAKAYQSCEQLEAAEPSLIADDLDQLRQTFVADARAARTVEVAFLRLLAEPSTPALVTACETNADADACVKLHDRYQTGTGGVAKSRKRANAYGKLAVKRFDALCRDSWIGWACERVADAYATGSLGLRRSASRARRYRALAGR